MDSIGSAFEIGKQTNFNHSFITPYARIEYFSAKNKELKMTNGMKVKLGNDKSLKAEAGVKAGYTFDIGEKSTLTPYIKASFENEFINDNTVLINDTVKLKNDYSGSMGNYRVGLDARINKNTSLYTEASYSKGSMIESPLNINAGVRVFF
ncbi:autotransporter outer membrane beta-barrel domain-containing protein [Providencia alcalifaciens]|uniref:autotransporter outer membrane beta-barrel domain-containing protein n=1 Tax=Providencia alcalifaciens TaxID=126385 RepID=UPI0012B52657|nr:autotransporter outer membrane beta-barrel domain-containing protein [Providencia alcalifaciens]